MADNASADIHDYLKLLGRTPETYRRSWDAIAIYDIEGRVITGNAVARAMIGTDRALTLRGHHFTAHMTLEAATKAARDFAHCVTLGQTVESSSVFIGARGELIPVRMRLVPARLDGRIVGVIGFARDSRARLDVEAQFMRSEQQFRSLFENHPDSLALHDREGRFVRVNAACVRLTGYSVEELVGQTAALITPPGGYDVETVRAAVRSGENTEFELPILTKSGSIREVDGRRVPLFVDGELRGYSVMMRDVTEERRAARNAARQATRIAELYRIAVAAGVTAFDKVETALQAGLTELEAEWAYVARIAGNEVEIAHAVGKKPAQMLDATLRDDWARLRAAIEREDVFVVDDQAAYPHSFSGAVFSVADQRYGAIVFVRSGGEPMNVSATDRDYIRALAVLIGSAIQQG